MGAASSPASTIPSGARNTPAQARLTLQALRAPRQSSEQAERNRASLRSSLVFHLRGIWPHARIIEIAVNKWGLDWTVTQSVTSRP